MASSEDTSPSREDTSARATLEEEVEYLTSQFKGQCKVISGSQGKFSKTIKLHPESLDIVFNFRLTDDYPGTPAVVEVRSECLDEDDLFDLHTYLAQLPDSVRMRGLEAVVMAALDWLKEGSIDVTGSRKGKDSRTNENKQQKNRKKSKKQSESKEKGKKPPMKTAIDVVKRIMWDEGLDRDHFLVGYIDRIDGLKEKYFNAFSWEDIASVDYTVLAIPKHRIQYFKYKNELVWDKRCRLDNVFGSTGSKTTIKDVIAKIDGVQQADADDNVDVDEAASPPAETHQDSDYYDSDDITDSDSDDSDDGITVTIGNMGASGGATVGTESVEEGKQKGNANADVDFNDEDDEADDFDKYWRDKLRPNHFLALRITDENIRKSAVQIQDQVVASEPRLKDCRIPSGALHLTLATVSLDTPEQIQNAVDCLKEAHSELIGIVPKDKKLVFKGVQNFFNRVIYGRVVDCPPEFYDFIEHLKTCLTSRGIEIRDYHEFVPHMTIMKVSRPVAKMTGNNYIAPWLYSSFNNTELGSQAVDNIHLCEMVDQRQIDGFYMSAASFDL